MSSNHSDKIQFKHKLKRKINSILSFTKRDKSDHRLKLDIGCDLPNKIIIGTHHKSGTVWLMNVFAFICDIHSLKFYIGKQENLPTDTDIFVEPHSDIELELFNKLYKGLHIIRDPRDIIVSACFYHQKSSEPWLHIPREKFNGFTYQEKLNSYTSFEDKLLFEMENASYRSITKIANWDYKNPLFYEVKYENLICDYDLSLFHNIFIFLGFPGRVIPSLLAIAYNNSLFSGKLNNSAHIRSGKAKQWTKYFNTRLKRRFEELYTETALIELGYENDTDWILDK